MCNADVMRRKCVTLTWRLFNFQGSQVTILHQTDRPYESTVHATSGNCMLRGLTIAHRSPSVANNYAVFLQGASLKLEVWHHFPWVTISCNARLLYSHAKLANIAA